MKARAEGRTALVHYKKELAFKSRTLKDSFLKTNYTRDVSASWVSLDY